MYPSRIITLIFVPLVSIVAFPPQPDPANTGLFTRSHKHITSVAIKRAAVDFIVRYNFTDTDGFSNSEILKKYFGTDGDSFEIFTKTIDTIVSHGNEIQKEMKSTAYFHVHGEQIEQAHAFIRLTIQSIREAATQIPVDLDFIRIKLGQIIYTIQSFYSNTNYVNLYGDKEYKEFGMENVTLYPISKASDDVCTDCPYDEASYEKGLCENNLISSSDLTSGYTSGQDITKPIGIQKCSHGTMEDDSRKQSATGGIYKGQSINAPHAAQHNQAHRAATRAVHKLLIDDGVENLVNYIGVGNFKNVLNIKSKEELSKTSLTLVIDVSGSMWDNIEAVKGAMKEVIRKAQSSTVTPYNYILITFNDPVSLQTEMETKDSELLLSTLDKLTVLSNMDCPEYSLTGLKRGVAMSREGATIYLSTDADAKDENLMDEIIEAAQHKAIKITFFLTGNCTGKFVKRKRRSAQKIDKLGRTKRSTLSVWDQIATQTGGAVYETPVSNLQIVVNSVVQDIYPSTFVNVQYITKALVQNFNVSVPFDSTITSLLIEVDGIVSSSDISIFYPDGSYVDISFENITISSVSGKINIEIKNPSPGEWKLQINENQDWKVNITANSALDFTYSLLEKGSDSHNYRLKSNPVKNKTYTLLLEATVDDNITVTRVNFFNSSNLKENTYDVDNIASEYFSTVVFGNTITMMEICGSDGYGNKFVRTLYTNIVPVQVELNLLPLARNLRLNKNETINYYIKNAGSENVSIVVTLTDNRGFIQLPSYNTYILSPGEEFHGCGYTIATSAGIVSYTVLVKDLITGTILQKKSSKALVSSVERPDCSVIQTNGECPLESLNTLNCSQYAWNSTISVTSSDISIAKISMNNAGSSTVLLHENITSNKGSVYAWVRSDCCTPSVYVLVVDEDGFFTRCHISLANEPVKIVTTPILSKDTLENIAATVVVTVIAILILLCVAKALYPSLKTWCRELSKSSHSNVTPLKQCLSSNVKFSTFNNYFKEKV